MVVELQNDPGKKGDGGDIGAIDEDGDVTQAQRTVLNPVDALHQAERMFGDGDDGDVELIIEMADALSGEVEADD